MISISRLYEQLFKVSFNDKVVIISRKGLNICSGILDNGLYFLRPTFNTLINTEMFKVEQPKSKKQNISPDDNTYL